MKKPMAETGDDCVAVIARHNQGRDERALPRKYHLMAASPFGFFRATAHLFYDHFMSLGVPSAPAAWICGDVHVENFGIYHGNNRLEYFDINDFDEACFGPLSADFVRLACSILLACEELGLEPQMQDQCGKASLEAYVEALRLGKAQWCERKTSRGAIKALFKQLKLRKRKTFLNARSVVTKGTRRLTLTPNRYLELGRDDEKPAALARLLGQLEGPTQQYFELRDVAYRIAGLSSLGLRRYAILVHGRGDPDRNALLDLKAGFISSAARLMPAKQPKWPTEATRIVTLQNRLQAVTAARLTAVRISRHDYILRALQPTEDRLNLAELAKNKAKGLKILEESFQTMGRLLAYAHLRGAAREGAEGPDAMMKFAAKADVAGWMALARQLKERNDADFSVFRTAYEAKDSRITSV